MDRMSPAARSRVMRSIRSRWTRQEVLFASLCDRSWVRGGRAECNADFVFRVGHAGVAVFLDGDFWHGRKIPETLPASWREKLARNAERDARNRKELNGRGWVVISIWESDFIRDPAGWVSEVLSSVEYVEEEVRVWGS